AKARRALSPTAASASPFLRMASALSSVSKYCSHPPNSGGFLLTNLINLVCCSQTNHLRGPYMFVEGLLNLYIHDPALFWKFIWCIAPGFLVAVLYGLLLE